MRRYRYPNSVARKRKRNREEEEEESEEDDESEEDEEIPKGRSPCKKCSKPSIPSNYGFCSFHRKGERKSPAEANENQMYDVLPHAMSTRNRYRSFLVNAQQRGKSVHVTMLRWMLLSCLKCAYCSKRGANILNGVDRIRNECHYTFNNSVPCCHTCNSEKGEMPLRLWMDRRGRPKTESEATYVASLLAAIA